MAVQPVVFTGFPIMLTGSAATLYTVPANPSQILLSGGRMRFANQDTATRAITAYAIPSGGAATITTCFANAVSISANQYLDIDLPALGAGGFYQAFADTTNKVAASQLAGVLLS